MRSFGLTPCILLEEAMTSSVGDRFGIAGFYVGSSRSLYLSSIVTGISLNSLRPSFLRILSKLTSYF